jgi:hypothetical protein
MKSQALIVAAIALAAMVSMSFYYSARIGVERIPMQWGLDGSANNLAPKTFVLWFFPAIAVFVGVAMFFTANWSEPEKTPLIWQAIMFAGIFLAVVQALHCIAVIHWAARQG